MPPDSGTPTDWLRALSPLVVHLHCVCSPSQAAVRFTQRQRHPGHLDRDRPHSDVLASLESLAALEPLRLGERVAVSTASAPDPAEVATEIQAAFIRCLTPPGSDAAFGNVSRIIRNTGIGCNPMAIEDIKNFVSLSEQLATAGQPSEQQIQELAREGFEVVLNLGLLDPRYCLPDEAGLTESLGMAYRHIPVDFNAPQFDDLKKFFDVMDESRNKRVFVHCAANYRVSGFVALYGQAKLGWSADQADAHIRRVWEPNDTWKEFIEKSRRNLRDGG